MEAGVKLNDSRKGIQNATNRLKAGVPKLFLLCHGLFESLVKRIK
jgi:hypothetical protein